MRNEILLLASVVVYYGTVLLAYRFFGKTGLYVYNAVAIIAANLEVMILVSAFGMDMTLGNVLFASTFLVTDVLSENEGKAAANKAVLTGVFAMLFFGIVAYSWRLFLPSANDVSGAPLITAMSGELRVILAGAAVFVVASFLDVTLYHRLWDLTTRKTGDSTRFLWLRNNAATLISQLVNAVLFNVLAFGGTYDARTLMTIILSTYVIYIVTSLADTPFVYLSRQIGRKQ